MQIYTKRVKVDPNINFAILEDPVPHKQHSNQQKGLDLYITVLNIDTGETCFKKLYENTKGLYFKHTGYSPMYLKSFTKERVYVPYQVLSDTE